jgi:glycosyltransferase involved in cell wall biosynthesis
VGVSQPADGAGVSRQLLAPPERDVRAGEAPRFSVAIAAYQAAEVVGEAVESALTQTAVPHEVIVCDDGSTDDIEAALAPYRDRIIFLTKQNGGEASAKNAAARAATGEFIALLDADDVFHPHRLEALGELGAARPDLDILTTDAYLEVGGRTIRRCYEGDHRFVVDDQRRGILDRNFVFGLAAVRRERLLAVGGFDESIRQTTDWDCWVRLIFSGSRAGLVDEPLARYRLMPGSLSSQREGHIEGRLMTLSKAAARTDLSAAERHVVMRGLDFNRRALALARARAAVMEGRSDARRLSLSVAFGSGFGSRTRVKAVASATAPGWARRRLASRPRETTAGILLPPAEEDRL